MVVSSVCQDTVYAEFRLRNRDVIVGYQKALITRFHGNAGFDRWNTSLDNQAASKQGGKQQLCQQSVSMLKQASALARKGFHHSHLSQSTSPTLPTNTPSYAHYI